MGYAQTGDSPHFETLVVSGAARQGDSGGAIFNAQNELVAVLWGTDGRRIVGTYCGRLRRFLKGARNRLPAPRHPPPPVAPQQPSTPPRLDGSQLDQFAARLDAISGEQQKQQSRLAALFDRLAKLRTIKSWWRARLLWRDRWRGMSRRRQSVARAFEKSSQSTAVGADDPSPVGSPQHGDQFILCVEDRPT